MGLCDYVRVHCTQKQFSFYRAIDMHIVDYAVARCPSVRPSVCHRSLW